MNRLCRSFAILCMLLIAAFSGCVGSDPPVLSTTTVEPPPSLAVDPCPLNVAGEAVTVDVPASGGAHALDVITGATCDWTVESRAPFISITTEKTGRGSATVTINVERNTGAQRSGEIVVNQLTVTVIQAAAPCAFAVTPQSFSFDKDGGTGTVSVTVTQGVDCQWSATSTASFAAVTSGSSGIGNGSVTFRVDSNPAETPRSGSLHIAGATVVVNQGARLPDPTYVLSVSGHQQPWCGSAFSIQSTPGPNISLPNAPGSFTHPARALARGTVVELEGIGAGEVVEWSGCDEDEFAPGVCRVTMGSNRSVHASIEQACAAPSFSSVSAMNVAGTWIVSFTAVDLLPFAGTAFGGVTFTASCVGFSTSTTLASQVSGTVSGTIMVPVTSCPSGGLLTLTDFNGTAQTSW